MNIYTKYCSLPERDLPVIGNVDVIVAGGTVGGITAAIKAASKGAKVFVISYMPYMGEDICGTYKYLFDEHESNNPFLLKLLPKNGSRTPYNVKKVLEDKLIGNNIDFLYSSYVSQVLFDSESEPIGVVINNRTGQQVILGKVIIDTTKGAYVAKAAGADFITGTSEEPHDFQFITIGNTSDASANKRLLPLSPKQEDGEYPAIEYSFKFKPDDWSYPSICKIEQHIRGLVWDADQLDSADELFYIPPYKIDGKKTYGGSRYSDSVPIEAFIPNNLQRLIVLGYCADIERDTVQDLMKPDNLLPLADKIGEAAADIAKADIDTQAFSGEANAVGSKSEVLDGEVKTLSCPVRSAKVDKTIKLKSTAVPVIAEYDVVIVGGGTAGANAAISAARNGAKTLTVEYLHGLGGTQTMGRIGVYFDGFREGFTEEIDKGVNEMAPADHPRQTGKPSRFVFDWKTEWYRREIQKAGGDVWFGAFGIGAFVNNGNVNGVLVATPDGNGVVTAKIVIDSTGSADIAIAAGSEYEYTDNELFAVQGAGLPFINLGDYYNNTDWTFTDDSDIYDVTRLYISGKSMFNDMFDIGKLPQTRERRRIIGDHIVSVLDVLNHRRYSDTISFHKSSFDTHGYTVDRYFTISPPQKRHTIYDADLPLRSLLPKGLDNIIVTGLGVSAHRDAMPVIRMQPCLQNQGYSVGFLSASAVKENCSVRQVDIKKIQEHLVENGILPERVLTDTDDFTFSDSRFEDAVKTLTNDFDGLEVLLTDPKKAKELLLDAYSQAKEDERVVYAQVLCMLGDETGVQSVIDCVRSYQDWDEGWDYTGMGQFGPCMSKLDSLIIALGESKHSPALPAILEKAKMLTPKHEFSHFRAVVMACEAIASSDAVLVLSELLDAVSDKGYVIDYKKAQEIVVSDKVDVTLRNQALREIFVARGLYRCGDYQKKGENVLKSYSLDLHGHYFLHASAVLSSGR